MAVRQYIGARYVTKIYENSLDSSSAEWEAGVTYEPLTLVTFNYSSYISKKEVPASVGDPASNPTYWTVSGAYNGQIANLQSQINGLKDKYVTINVKDLPPTWGLNNLIGDGVTDDTAALRALINYVTAVLPNVYNIYNQTRIALYFPEGIYIISGTITLPKYISLYGENQQSTSFYTSDITNTIFECQGYNKIQNLNIQNTDSGNATNDCLHFTGIQNEVYDVRIYNFKCAVRMTDAQGTKFMNMYISSNVSSSTGFTLTGRCVSSKWIRVNIHAVNITNMVGILYESGSYCMDLHFLMVEMAQINYGIVLRGVNTTYPGDIIITSCIFDSVKSSAIYITDVNTKGNVMISDCWIDFDSLTTNHYAIYCGNSNNINIRGCRIAGYNADSETWLYGAYFTNCSGCIFSNNLLLNLKYAAAIVIADNIIINDNILISDKATSGTGFLNVADLDRGSIIGNKMNGTTSPFSYDIVVPAGRYCTHTFIKNNSLVCNSPITISDPTCIISDNMQ